MLKPICYPCQRFFRMVKSGVYFVESMPADREARPGVEDADKWKPYKIWSGDKWMCQGCGAEIISGVGMNPIAEHYQEGFDEMKTRLNVEYAVNDC